MKTVLKVLAGLVAIWGLMVFLDYVMQKEDWRLWDQDNAWIDQGYQLKAGPKPAPIQIHWLIVK